MAAKMLPAVTGAKIIVQPMLEAERDEIAAMVMRIKRADERSRHAGGGVANAPAAEDVKWAEDWKLPREVFDYFELERAA